MSTAADHLLSLEESLWREATRFDPVYMDSVLHADFTEVGASGKTYDRATSLSFTSGMIGALLPLEEVTATFIEPDVCLLRYVSRVETPAGVERVERTSIWVADGERWLLRFHQGTATS